MLGATRVVARDVVDPDEEEEEFKDASDTGEVFFPRGDHPADEKSTSSTHPKGEYPITYEAPG